MVIEHVEQGTPLEYLDLCTCFAVDCTIQLLAEIVVDMQEPLDVPPIATESSEGLLGWYGNFEFDGRPGRGIYCICYDDMDNSEYEDGDED